MFPAAEVPLFELEDARGERHGTSEFWQRREMLIALVHPAGCTACEALLEHLATRRAELHADEIEAVVVSMKGTRPDAPELHVLADSEGGVAPRLASHGEFAEGEARLLAADRFGRLYGTEDIHSGDPESVLIAALGWIEFAQSRCEECGPALEWG